MKRLAIRRKLDAPADKLCLGRVTKLLHQIRHRKTRHSLGAIVPCRQLLVVVIFIWKNRRLANAHQNASNIFLRDVGRKCAKLAGKCVQAENGCQASK